MRNQQQPQRLADTIALLICVAWSSFSRVKIVDWGMLRQYDKLGVEESNNLQVYSSRTWMMFYLPVKYSTGPCYLCIRRPKKRY